MQNSWHPGWPVSFDQGLLFPCLDGSRFGWCLVEMVINALCSFSLDIELAVLPLANASCFCLRYSDLRYHVHDVVVIIKA